MAMVRSWSVESKAIEMLIKGGYAGLRMVERSNKKQGSIYIQRDELKWLVGAVEEAVDVDTSVVYWNQSRAGYPRVLVQRRSNRHGRFIIMEEFEGRTRRGSVLIPEGRYGQGWTRLLSELKIARTTLWNGREFRESKVGEKVSDKRTFAEVVSQPKMPEKVITGGREQQQTRPTITETLETEKCDGYAQHQSRPMNMKPSENEYLGVRALTHVQTRPEINLGKKQVQWGSSQETEVAGGHQGEPAKCVLHEALQNPAISGAAAQNGGWESERNGASSLHARAELQEILKCLTDIRGQVDLGLKRVELAIQFMEQGESMGQEFMDRGRSSEVGGWAKPKKKKFKQMSKTQAGLLGSKPDKAPVLDARAGLIPSEKAQYRVLSRRPAQQTTQIGESSKMGAARVSGSIPAMNAGFISGVRSKGVGAGVTSSAKETEKAGELVGDTGLFEVQPATQFSDVPESSDQLGGEYLAPMRITQGSVSSETMLSVIPETVECPGLEAVTPVKSSKRGSDHSDYAGDVRSDGIVPVKQAKQFKVFQRRESPSPKVTKSWVAERVAWNGGRDDVGATEDSSGKNDSVSEELAVNRFSLLGEDEELGDLGGMGNREEDLGSPVSKT
jgi:hypothetical protein